MRFRYSTEENGKLVKKAVVYTQDEHGIKFEDVDREAVYIIERLKANGWDTYIVGGAVRDLILGKKPKDFDIVSAASPARIKRIFRSARIIGHRFRLVHVYFGQKIFEVSTFRSIKDGPTSNTFGTIEEDVLRRDFTLNALFYDPLKQIVIDYVGGMKDIWAKKVKPIIPLARIFTDDPVRMIRAVKYGAAADFTLPFSLRYKIRKQSYLLADISPSRLTEEISKIIRSSQAAKIVESLDLMGLYQYLQPRAAELFRTRPGFREQYLKTLAFPGDAGFKNLPGEVLAGLVRDYLETAADWKGGPGKTSTDCYKEAFIEARQFVLPMNPPRMELDHGVRLLFAEHGVIIKKSAFTDRHGWGSAMKLAQHHDGKAAGQEAPETGDSESAEAPANDDAVKKHHRRRRRPLEAKEETL